MGNKNSTPSYNPFIELSIEINAPLELVWDYVMDNRNGKEWSCFFEEIVSIPHNKTAETLSTIPDTLDTDNLEDQDSDTSSCIEDDDGNDNDIDDVEPDQETSNNNSNNNNNSINNNSRNNISNNISNNSETENKEKEKDKDKEKENNSYGNTENNNNSLPTTSTPIRPPFIVVRKPSTLPASHASFDDSETSSFRTTFVNFFKYSGSSPNSPNTPNSLNSPSSPTTPTTPITPTTPTTPSGRSSFSFMEKRMLKKSWRNSLNMSFDQELSPRCDFVGARRRCYRKARNEEGYGRGLSWDEETIALVPYKLRREYTYNITNLAYKFTSPIPLETYSCVRFDKIDETTTRYTFVLKIVSFSAKFVKKVMKAVGSIEFLTTSVLMDIENIKAAVEAKYNNVPYVRVHLIRETSIFDRTGDPLSPPISYLTKKQGRLDGKHHHRQLQILKNYNHPSYVLWYEYLKQSKSAAVTTTPTTVIENKDENKEGA